MDGFGGHVSILFPFNEQYIEEAIEIENNELS